MFACAISSYTHASSTEYVLIKLFLKRWLCTRSLYTSVWAIFVDRYMCSSNCFSGSGCAREACIQASGRFLWTVLCAHKTISQEVVVHEKLVYKRLDDFCGPLYVLIKLFLRKQLCTRSLYTSICIEARREQERERELKRAMKASTVRCTCGKPHHAEGCGLYDRHNRLRFPGEDKILQEDYDWLMARIARRRR